MAVRVFGSVKVDTVETLDCGEEAAGWLCKYFQREGLRLHFSHPDLEKRDSFNAKKAWAHPAKPGDLVSDLSTPLGTETW